MLKVKKVKTNYQTLLILQKKTNMDTNVISYYCIMHIRRNIHDLNYLLGKNYLLSYCHDGY